jgi:hypothetical protein
VGGGVELIEQGGACAEEAGDRADGRGRSALARGGLEAIGRGAEILREDVRVDDVVRDALPIGQIDLARGLAPGGVGGGLAPSEEGGREREDGDEPEGSERTGRHRELGNGSALRGSS